MGISTDQQAYADCFGYFDRALATTHGIQKWFPAHPPAYDLRMRLNYARTIDKRINTRFRESDDPLYGSSIYSQIRIRLFAAEGGGWWLQLLKVSADAIDDDDGWVEIGEEEEEQELQEGDLLPGAMGNPIDR
jgi:hypothetical protein